MVIAPPEESLPILLGIVGDCRDTARLERGNCKDKRAENKWEKRVLYCQREEGQKYKRMTSTRVTAYYSQRPHGM